MTQGDAVAAESAYRSAIVQDTKTKDWKLGLAQSLLQQGKAQEVIAIMNPILAQDPDNKQFWLFQTHAYMQLNDLESAAINLEIIKALGKANASDLNLLGNIYMRKQMPEQALLAYQALLEGKEAQNNQEAALKAARLLVQTRSWAAAETLVNEISSTYAAQLPEQKQLDVLNLQAKIAFAQGQDAKGAEILESIVNERDPNDGEALLELARYYQAQGDIERAILKLEYAQKLEPYRYKALVQHAQLLADQKKFAEAVPLLRDALKLKEDNRVRSYMERLERAARR